MMYQNGKNMLMSEQVETRRIVTLRLPVSLWDKLKKISKDNKRSITAQAELMLEQQLDLIAENEPR